MSESMAPSPDPLWTIRAQRNLRHALAEKLCHEVHEKAGASGPCGGVLEAEKSQIETLLKEMFKGQQVVVKDQMLGYRRKPDAYVLLVEVFGEDGGNLPQGAYVVKIGKPKHIEEEIKGWACCHPPGLKHDLVFLEMVEGPRSDDGKLQSIRYGDAQQFLGVPLTVPLEAALLETIKHGSPKIASARGVITELFERVGFLLYSQAFVDDPLRERYVFNVPKLHIGMSRWRALQVLTDDRVVSSCRASEDEKGETRDPEEGDPAIEFASTVAIGDTSTTKGADVQEGTHAKEEGLPSASNLRDLDKSCVEAHDLVHMYLTEETERFLDPIQNLEYLAEHVDWNVGTKERPIVLPHPAIQDYPKEPGLPPPAKVAGIVPRLLRGCAHGDLHGRNVLVGIVHQRMMWPTVFDYEDMGPCNLIGWDFVKLETELKVRAYIDVFSGKDHELFIKAIKEFEFNLAEATEEAHKKRDWPPIDQVNDPPARLKAVLLMIRRMASEQMGDDHGRPNDWLEEYYFLLMCYGVHTGRFPNYQLRERLGAYISSGVACARLRWPRDVISGSARMLS